jgi:hypothetical protein
MCYQRKTSLQDMLKCESMKEVQNLLKVSVTPYWQTHYHFGAVSGTSTKQLSTERLNLIVINAVIPMLFAYGRHHSKDELCERAFDLLEQLKAENNYITRM